LSFGSRPDRVEALEPSMAKQKRSGPTALDRIVEWFIPAKLAEERETRQRARMFLISHFFGPIIATPIPAYLYLQDPAAGAKVGVIAASIYAFWLFPPLLRWSVSYTALAVLSVQNLIFCILWGCYFYGGATSPFLPWLLTVPLLAFFYLGPAQSSRIYVLVLLSVNLIGFYGLYLLNGSFPPSSLTSMHNLGVVSTLGTAVYVSMMALYYAKMLASQVELEGVMKGHMATATELRRATVEAERAGAAKAEFLAKMSHELRTPLNAVIGYSQMLLEDAQDEGDAESAADLDRIHRAGHHLLRLVNEVLDLSKIEAGKMDLNPETIEVATFLTNMVDGYRETAKAEGNTLELRLAPDLGTITCDPRKTAQAISQIVDNAIKFTKDGEIVVSASRRSAAEGDQILVVVRDTGIGMAPEAIPGLFEKFTVAEDASSSKYGGTGLGLALSLRLCRLMGGDISAESRLGVGSTFTVTMPVTPPVVAVVGDGESALDADDVREAA
jgi:signal transduction histidine kinase